MSTTSVPSDQPSTDRSPSDRPPFGDADFVVVANRLPVDLVRTAGGAEEWKRSPGGLVTALEPVLRARRGAWVGWPGLPDADVAPFTEDGVRLHPVTISANEFEEFYEGFSNATLWPLYHDVIVQPEYHRAWWNTYVRVNERFARATAETAAEGATVWVQDYQLQLVPGMLRALRPDLTIGFFLHIPFPPVELFRQLPWRREILEGLLGADLVGFHLAGGARNFLTLAKSMLDLQVSRSAVGVRRRPGEIRYGSRRVQVGAFPISIDSGDLDAKARSAATRSRARELRAELGKPGVLLLGVDRLDYTKGIDVRLTALKELLDEGRLRPDEVTMVQLATPSRERVEQYRILRDGIEQTVARINGEYGEIGRPVVHYIHRPVPRDDLLALYSTADVMLVTPLRDGMNLVAKEYVACHPKGDGALVLSEFTGAAQELRQAYLCNPHDTDGVKDAIMDAITSEKSNGRQRMRALRRQVMTHDVDLWAQAFLDRLAETRS